MRCPSCRRSIAQVSAPTGPGSAQPGAPASAQPGAPAFHPALATKDLCRYPQLRAKMPKYLEFRNLDISKNMAMDWVKAFLEKRVAADRKGILIPSLTLNAAFEECSAIHDIHRGYYGEYAIA